MIDSPEPVSVVVWCHEIQVDSAVFGVLEERRINTPGFAPRWFGPVDEIWRRGEVDAGPDAGDGVVGPACHGGEVVTTVDVAECWCPDTCSCRCAVKLDIVGSGLGVREELPVCEVGGFVDWCAGEVFE